MADGYWNHQQPPLLPTGGAIKRSRPEYDVSPSRMLPRQEMPYYLSRDSELGEPQSVKDTKTIDSAYDRYLRSAQYSLNSGEAGSYSGVGFGRPPGGGVSAHQLADRGVLGHPGAFGSDMVPNGRNRDFGAELPLDAIARPGRETLPLPRDASNTLFVEGLPRDSTKREVAHIFRPFVGYREVRLVSKESKQRGKEPVMLCFVDFTSPACAATAMSALQGYKMDEHDPDSNYLRLQFSRYPGARSGSGAGTRSRR